MRNCKRIHLKNLDEDIVKKLFPYFHNNKSTISPLNSGTKNDIGVVDLWIGPVLSLLHFVGAKRSWTARHLTPHEEELLKRVLLITMPNNQNAYLGGFVRSLVLNIHLSTTMVETLAIILRHCGQDNSRSSSSNNKNCSSNNKDKDKDKDNKNNKCNATKSSEAKRKPLYWCGGLLESLDLSFHYELNDCHMAMLAEALITNTKLKTLSLLHCARITKKSIQHFINSLKYNMTLQQIDWMGTNAQEEVDCCKQQYSDPDKNNDINITSDANHLKQELDFYLNLNKTGRRRILEQVMQSRNKNGSYMTSHFNLEAEELSHNGFHRLLSLDEDLFDIIMKHKDVEDAMNLGIVYYFLRETSFRWSYR